RSTVATPEPGSLRRQRRVLGLLLLPMLFLPACMLRDLGRNLKMLGEYAVLRGNVAAEQKTPVIVVVYSADDGPPHAIDAFLQARPGAYYFLVPAGTYRLAAFEDIRDDQVYDRGED